MGLRVSYRAGTRPTSGIYDGSTMAAAADGTYLLHVPLAYDGPPTASPPATNGQGGIGRVFISIESILSLTDGGGPGYKAVLLVSSEKPPESTSAAVSLFRELPLCKPEDEVFAGTVCTPMATELAIGGTVWGSAPSGGWRYFVIMQRHSFLQLKVKTIRVQSVLNLLSEPIRGLRT